MGPVCGGTTSTVNGGLGGLENGAVLWDSLQLFFWEGDFGFLGNQTPLGLFGNNIEFASSAGELQRRRSCNCSRDEEAPLLACEITPIYRAQYAGRQQPRGFRDLPAISRWFAPSSVPGGEHCSRRCLNYDYLEPYGNCHVPLELTTIAPTGNPKPEESFKRFHAPLSLFLDWTRSLGNSSTESPSGNAERPVAPNVRLYLAQCQLLDLAAPLRDDFPVPSYVANAGRGDIYDTNVWIGIAPTYTPLHKDPNPNIFVQLAGTKHVRLLPPDAGLAIFSAVREQIGRSGGAQNAAFRGEDMMRGLEKDLLDQAIWGPPGSKDSEAPIRCDKE
ncbi:conserved hypothetical protein [Uncinocarpus reesii 1704]|uniref:Cupin-like domain-containing protein n=1 Tax=Uncinocarpus reesii (strain UAMH 1704) TaxID=336963 RepID=C4JT46_UNCRE|nr:uncharacterized protein UREG_05635 [Uncinocarpus reesii 1704]EEP80793.1 conserved hypothetical protein [Uncinocarpus reesii 1704]